MTLHLQFTGTLQPTVQEPGGNSTRLSLTWPGISRTLLNQEIRVSFGKISLVGFPEYTSEKRKVTPRGTVYILAVLVERESSRSYMKRPGP